MIKVQALTKSYGDHIAVDHLSFEVQRGEILGFLGPNGAGKSTTMKMLTCFLAPTSGSIQVGGYAAEKEPEAIKNMVGYLPETSPSYADMTVYEFLEFIAEIRGFSGEIARQKIESVIEKCFLEKVRAQTIDTLSKGYRQRVGFAQAILHDPPVLILDEPTDGLDPNQKHEVRHLIRNMGQDKCIILSTHILEEVEELCSRIIIINNGRIVADGSPDEIRAKSESMNAIEISLHQIRAEEVLPKLRAVAGVERVDVLPGGGDSISSFLILPRERQNVLGPVAELARRENWVLETLNLHRGRLDEVFRQLTTEVVR